MLSTTEGRRELVTHLVELGDSQVEQADNRSSRRGVTLILTVRPKSSEIMAMTSRVVRAGALGTWKISPASVLASTNGGEAARQRHR